MTENKGLALEKILREHILPYLIKKIDSTRELAATLSDNDLKQLDDMFIKSETNRITNEANKKLILNGKIAEGVDSEAIQQGVQESLQGQGSQRFIVPSEIEDVTWSDIIKDMDYTLEVDITGEASNKEVIMSTLTDVLQTVATNPNILNDPTMRTLFNKIVEQTGVISSVELYRQPTTPQVQAPAPAETPVGRK